MLSQFPSRDLDEPVTKDFVRAEVSDLSGALRAEIGDLRTEMHSEIGQLRADVYDRFRQHTMWIAGTNVVAVTLATVLSRLIG